MKNFIKKITGLEKEQEKLDADKKELAKQEEELLSKRDPKAYATRKKQPWVGVLDVKVNEKNVRNGFFELDWNKYFIEQLVNAGYGVANDPDEEIVDRFWQTFFDRRPYGRFCSTDKFWSWYQPTYQYS